MKPNKLILASSIALAITTSQLGNAAIEIQNEQKWLKQQMTVDKSKERTVAYYIRYNPQSRANIQTLLQANNVKINHHLADVNTYSVSLPASQLQTLNSISGIEFMEPVPERHLMAQVTPWNIDQFQARDVWDADRDGQIDDGAPTGAGVKLCIIDTGFYAAHDDFQGITHTGESQISGETYTEDGNGHGTHVAGTANAMNNDIGVVGVMPGGAELHIIKIFNNAGVWSQGESDLAAAAYACRDAGANAISMSLGGGFSATEENVFQDLYDNDNIISVAAAGNDGNSVASYPASYDSVVSVGALNEAEGWASFSQFPATSNDPINQPANNEWDVVELSGGGDLVLSTWPGPPHGNVPIIQVSNDGSDYSANQIDETTAGDVTANLADGGLCEIGDSDPSWAGNVVLCERGNISFAEKMNNVANEGGVAAIIFNNEPGNFSGTCSGGCTLGANIPGVSIAQADGQFLQTNGLALPTNVLVDDGTSSCNGCLGGYNTISGTSMATPGVAAGIAWAWSACGGPSGINNKQLRQLLRDSAKDIDATGYDVRTGFGLVQLKDALDLGNQLFGSQCSIAITATPTEIEVCTAGNAADATFNLTLGDDFTGTSNLTSSGVPAGASGSFNPAQVVFPATTTDFTVTSLDGVSSGNYALSLTATDDSDASNNATANVALITVDANPGSANLTLPADGAVDVATQATFSWSASSQAASYGFEIATDAAFTNVIESASDIATNSYTLTSALNNESVYFWRVTANNICGDTTSSTSSFTTGTEVCQVFNSTDVPVVITDQGTPTVTSLLNVATTGTITDVNVVNLAGTHSWISDLTFTLESPAATSVSLIDQACFNEDNFDLDLDDEAASGTLPCPPTDGLAYQPAGDLSTLDGQVTSGEWTLTISDAANIDGGQLNSWGLNICYIPNDNVPANAVNDTASMLEDAGTTTLNVMDNDTNAGSSTITSITQGTNGSVAILSGDTTVSYTANDDFCGTDSFNYTLDGLSNATVNVTVDCVNDQPDFTVMTEFVVDQIDSNNPPTMMLACDMDMGPDDEDSSQTMSDFIVSIDSDPNSILSMVDVLDSGELDASFSGNMGTAVINVALQDDGGTAGNGVDTSVTKQVTIHVNDVLFNGGFETIEAALCPQL